MEEEKEDTYTYEIRLSVATCYINSEVYETVSIYDIFGLSDQEWDEMWQNIDTGWEKV